MGTVSALRAEPAEDPVIRIFLVDDHEVIRSGLRGFVDDEPDLHVVGEAGTAGEALAYLEPAAPDVVVVDLRLPDGDGVELCREIRSRHPHVRVLILTSFADDAALMEAILAGASGYLLKTTKREDLLDDVRRVAGGQSLLDPNVTSALFARLRRAAAASESLATLTEQERRVLTLIGQGMTNTEIARSMFLAEQTVKNYVSSVLGKLGLRGRTQAALFAARLDDA
jgi:two-component system, NarL family, response regulator DevR